jgi:hypothetical protein
MMCLGWDNNPICQPPDSVQIIAPSPSQPATAAGDGVPLTSSGGLAAVCPDITWFWICAGIVAGGSLLRGATR